MGREPRLWSSLRNFGHKVNVVPIIALAARASSARGAQVRYSQCLLVSSGVSRYCSTELCLMMTCLSLYYKSVAHCCIEREHAYLEVCALAPRHRSSVALPLLDNVTGCVGIGIASMRRLG